jgi:hypothetical protein
MNVKIKYYLFIFISLFFISCDFDEIESFEMPAWNWPLSFPLLDESYSFAEMGVALGPDSIYYNAAGDSAVNNNIFFDEIDSTLFIEFSAATISTSPDVTRIQIGSGPVSYKVVARWSETGASGLHRITISNIGGDKTFADDLNKWELARYNPEIPMGHQSSIFLAH